MEQLQHAQSFVLNKTFTRLYRYFFNAFMNEVEIKDRVTRIRFLLRFTPSMFLVSYPLALMLSLLVVSITHHHFYFDLYLILETSIGLLSGFFIGTVWDAVMNRPVGILGGMWLGIWLAMWAAISWSAWIAILLTTIGGIALGCGVVKSIGKITTSDLDKNRKYFEDFRERRAQVGRRRKAFEVICEGIGIIVFYLIEGATPDIEQSKTRRIGALAVSGLIVGMVVAVFGVLVSSAYPWDIIQFIGGAIIAGSLTGILAGVALGRTRNWLANWGISMGSGVVIGSTLGNFQQLTVTAIAVAITPAVVTAIICGIIILVLYRDREISTPGKARNMDILIFLAGIVLGTVAGRLENVLSILLFLLCYGISYTQLPISLFSSISIINAIDTISENPSEIFMKLRTSSLYWDEWAVLPVPDSNDLDKTLPGRAYTMRLAVEQDIEQAAEILKFIEAERPFYFAEAQAGAREGFLQLLEHRMRAHKTLRDISEATEQFTQLQATSSGLNITRLDEIFVLLNDVCLDATHYRNSLGWQARHDALQHMITNLRNIQNLTRDPRSYSLRSIIRWRDTAQHELDKLQQEPGKIDQINNPYVVGQALQPGTSLFVGRQDLVQQLEQGLGRGSHRPTFFLNGERRMGKSSTLRQLPFLLDARHFLPTFFDLQAPEMTSSAAAFLGTIAEKMTETLKDAGMQVEPLASQQLLEAQRENEASVYYAFNTWLKQVEHVLAQNERIVLLSFDEFENLETVGKARYLDLHLLLNWFRSVIQNRPQLALLFSGGKSISEFGQETDFNWSGYFVNVQTFRVSFLREAEARHLITRPIPDYPIEQIFGTGVVDEIIRVTGCHPFLVQAACSNLVNNLNADGRNRAEIQDVAVAVTQVLESWEDSYFRDLWTRTDPEQRTCLIALHDLGKADAQQIAQHIRGQKAIAHGALKGIRHSLQTLLKRDLVLAEDKTYQIATPIFSQWVERNS